MKIAFIALLVSTALIAQEDCDLQYDGNGDGAVNVQDVLGVLSEFGVECEPVIEYGPCGPDSTVSYHGYDYSLIEIGEQCWFAENLRTELYQIGDSIPGGLGDYEWTYGSDGAQAIYGEGTSSVYQGSTDEIVNLSNHGRLYNWHAVDDPRGLCPNSWHVPFDEEFIILEQELGMDSLVAALEGFRGTDQGTRLKSSPSDTPPWNGSNLSGFSGLAGGERQMYGGFFSEGSVGYFWAASLNDDFGWTRALIVNREDIGRYTNVPVRTGRSVRCIKD